MKIAMAVLFFGVMLCGCSPRQATRTKPAIDWMQPGRAVDWGGGTVSRIEKRDGMAVQGIKLTFQHAPNPDSTVTADSGTLVPGSPKDSSDTNSVTIVLTNAKTVSPYTDGTIIQTNKTLSFLLHYHFDR